MARRGATVLAVAVFAVALMGVGAAHGAVSYRSATYAASLQFSGISTSAQGLGLYGTATEAGNQGVDCLEADVNPVTLALSDVFEPRCDDPRMTGHPVVPVEVTVERWNYIAVRVARLDQANGHIEVGPVLGTDEDASDTRPLWAYGPGSLWIYLTAPLGSPKASEALRVSTSTGQLVQTARVSPALYRPVLAADADGLYLSPAVNGGAETGPGGSPSVIFRVGIGATKSDTFYRWPAGKWYGFADWMTGYSGTLFADLCQRGGPSAKCVLATFQGPDSRPPRLVALPNLDGWALGNPTVGLFSTLVPAGQRSAPVPTTVVRMDPSTGSVRPLASVVLPAYWAFLGLNGNPDAALYDGALYLLSPSSSNLSGAGAPATLYRIPVVTGR